MTEVLSWNTKYKHLQYTISMHNQQVEIHLRIWKCNIFLLLDLLVARITTRTMDDKNIYFNSHYHTEPRTLDNSINNIRYIYLLRIDTFQIFSKRFYKHSVFILINKTKIILIFSIKWIETFYTPYRRLNSIYTVCID